jgi:RNA polymerase sigma-70 factor (ECF subfamily)
MNKLTDFVRASLSARRAGDLHTLSVDWAERTSDAIETFEDAAEWIRSGSLEEPISRAELAIDLETACARLTPRQQSICQLICREGASVRAVSKELQVSRVTVYSELARIRNIFEGLGLSSYLDA